MIHVRSMKRMSSVIRFFILQVLEKARDDCNGKNFFTQARVTNLARKLYICMLCLKLILSRAFESLLDNPNPAGVFEKIYFGKNASIHSIFKLHYG